MNGSPSGAVTVRALVVRFVLMTGALLVWVLVVASVVERVLAVLLVLRVGYAVEQGVEGPEPPLVDEAGVVDPRGQLLERGGVGGGPAGLGGAGAGGGGGLLGRPGVLWG